MEACSTHHAASRPVDDRRPYRVAWHYLPVEVPPGSCGLRVELDYDAVGRGPRPRLRPAAASAAGRAAPALVRHRRDAATPGYLPGELEPAPGRCDRPPPAARRRGGVPADGRGEQQAGRAPAGTPGAPRRRRCRPADRPPPGRCFSSARQALAGQRPAHPHGALGRGTDGRRAVSFCRRAAVSTSSRSPITTRSATTRELPAAAARYGIILLPGQEVTTTGGHAGALGEVGWVDFRLPADAWLEQTERRGGLLSVNHPIAGHAELDAADAGARRRWSRSGTGAGSTCAGPRRWPGGWPGTRRDPGRRQRLAPAGRPTRRPGRPPPGSSAPADGPDAVLDGLRDGRVAISGRRDGPVLLRAERRDDRGGRGGNHPGGPGRAAGPVRRPRETFPAAA